MLPILSFPTLLTERLRLRPLRLSDDENLYRLRSDERVNRYINRSPAASVEEARATIEKLNAGIAEGKSLYWAVAQREDDILIGAMCLFNLDAERNSAEIGYELHPDFQGKGFMQEAVEAVIRLGFGQIKWSALTAFTSVDNARSVHLLKKLNFERAPEMDVEEGTVELSAWVLKPA